MIGRLSLLIGALAAGFAVASFLPEWPQRLRIAIGFSSVSSPRSQESTPAERVKSGAAAKDDQQGLVKLSDDEIKSAGIEFTVAQAGTIAHHIVVPGTVIPHADRIAHVAVKVSGTVAELRKKVGDPAFGVRVAGAANIRPDTAGRAVAAHHVKELMCREREWPGMCVGITTAKTYGHIEIRIRSFLVSFGGPGLG